MYIEHKTLIPIELNDPNNNFPLSGPMGELRHSPSDEQGNEDRREKRGQLSSMLRKMSISGSADKCWTLCYRKWRKSQEVPLLFGHRKVLSIVVNLNRDQMAQIGLQVDR